MLARAIVKQPVVIATDVTFQGDPLECERRSGHPVRHTFQREAEFMWVSNVRVRWHFMIRLPQLILATFRLQLATVQHGLTFYAH